MSKVVAREEENNKRTSWDLRERYDLHYIFFYDIFG